MTQKYIEVIQAHMDGKKIEYRHADPEDEDEGGWRMPAFITWNFAKYEYRIAPEPKIPDSIDWSHVGKEFNFMARDGTTGDVYLYAEPPVRSGDMWKCSTSTECAAIYGIFSSYKRGNLEWQDSLVARPQP